MEGCIVCGDSVTWICTSCKLRFCSKHKQIHEKRARKSHIFSKSELKLSPNSLSTPVITQVQKSLERISPCISGSLSNQEMEGVKDWYEQNYMPSPTHTLTIIKSQYLKCRLSKDNQIFLQAHNSPINAIIITSDSQYIISTSYAKSIRIWSLKSGIQEYKLKGHTEAVFSLAITSDNKLLV